MNLDRDFALTSASIRQKLQTFFCLTEMFTKNGCIKASKNSRYKAKLLNSNGSRSILKYISDSECDERVITLSSY